MRQSATAYASAFGVLGAALVARWLLDPWLGGDLVFVTLFGAVAFSVWKAGSAPAVVVSAIGYLAVNLLFISPRGRLGPLDAAHIVGAAAYLSTCGLIIAFGEAARRAARQASEGRELMRVTLKSIGDAVITTDVVGRITYLNAVAETVTGWPQRDAIGRPLDSVFRIVNEDTRVVVESPATRALREGIVVGLANHTVLIRRDGSECPIDDSAAPIRDEHGRVSGCVLIFRDVTTQRQAEQAKGRELHAARLLAAIVESSDDAIVSKSLDGTIQSWNAAAERLFGHTESEAVGQHISLIIPADRLSEEDQIIAQLKAGLRIDHFETERIRRDGQRVRVSLTISPVRDQSGAVVGASKIARDVSAQRAAEQRERLLMTEALTATAKFQAFFEQSASFAAILDVDGTIVESNRLLTEGCGFARDRVIGQPLWTGPWWQVGDAAALVRKAIVDATQGSAGRVEVPYATADGDVRVAVIVVQAIKGAENRILSLAFSGADITDLKKAEAERQKFVTLVENSPDFIGLCDLNGKPFFVNRAGLDLVGLDDLQQAIETPVASFFFPEDQHRVMHEFFPAVLAHGHGEIEIRFRHFKTGAARWMAYKVLTLPGLDGSPIGFATVSQDVTERKRLADGLRDIADRLSEADQKKNEFIAMLAHELRNPLAPISNAARALRLGISDPSVVATTSEMLDRQVAQLARLVDDLLDVSRISRGKIELRRTNVALALVIEQAVEAARPLCASMNHQLTVTLPPPDVIVDGDAARLAQVVGNLLNNACKFTNRGGHIALTCDRQGEGVVIRVRDDGIGIAPEHLPTLFELFKQVDTSLERSRDGLGIGLALVKTLVEMHGGSIALHSDGPGQGTEAVVWLPAVVAPSASDLPSRTPAAVLPSSLRVLVVDDNDDGAESLMMLLEFGGHTVEKAGSGPEALATAERFRPDVILLDIGLPGMSGYEVCRRLRQHAWGKAIVVVALTGWGQDEDRERSREAGFDEHMTKPVDHDALLVFLSAVAATNASRQSERNWTDVV